MAMIAIYIILALFSTFLGSITGMGGGVIMKPVMDMLGHFDSVTIGVLSSVTVFSMAVVSCLKSIGKKPRISLVSLLLLGLGSIGGGFVGQWLFDMVVKNFTSDALVKILQNAILGFIIIIIFIYMLNKEKVKTLSLKNPLFFILTGIVLGILSSFLGIGGGPINVALIMLLFSVDIKTATFASIVTILFAQISKLGTVFFTTGFSGLDLKVLPFMVIAAIVGSFVGSIVAKRVSERIIVYFFNGMQLLVMGICIINIVRYALI